MLKDKLFKLKDLVKLFSLLSVFAFSYFFWVEIRKEQINLFSLIIPCIIVLGNIPLLISNKKREVLPILADALAYSYLILRVPTSFYFSPVIFLGLALSWMFNIILFDNNAKNQKIIQLMLILTPLFDLFRYHKAGFFWLDVLCCVCTLFICFFADKTFKQAKESAKREMEMGAEMIKFYKEVEELRARIIRHDLANIFMRIGMKVKNTCDSRIGKDNDLGYEAFNLLIVEGKKFLSSMTACEKETFNLSEIVQKTKMEEKYKNMSFVSRGLEDPCLNGDKMLISTFIKNIIDNSLEAYGEQKKKLIVIEMRNGILSLSDEAGGFNTEQIAEGFSTKNKNMPGCGGFGLYMLKRVFSLLNMEMTIESTMGVGTKVSLDTNRWQKKEEPRKVLDPATT